MSRKTYTMSAAATAVIAGLSFSSADAAGAFSQGDGEAGTEAAVQETVDVVETVPALPEFVAEPVVQELPEPAEVEATPSYDANSLRELVGQVDANTRWSDEMQCLAGAVYFEARGEPLVGQLAVADVVINRAQDSRFPASYCGVVYQRKQFSFVKNGRMPRIRTGSAAWQRARAIARIAHDGLWDSNVGDAVYFHAKYVRPSWSYRKTRTAQIDTHIFYR